MKTRKVEISPIFERNEASKKQYIINEGGRRSSKSWSIAQVIIKRFTQQKNKRILICRKTLPALKLSAYQLFLSLLKDYDYYRFCKHNKTDRTIELHELNNYIYFGSCDDPDKLKSTEWNIIWLMEAKEFTYEDFMILDPSLSGKTEKGEINQMFMDFNPDDVPQWIDDFIGKNSANVDVIKSNYLDNPFLEDSYIQKLEGLKKIDEYYYKVFTLGERAKLKGKIYERITTVSRDKWPEKFDDSCFSVDWGFRPDPNVLLFVGKIGNDLYLDELIYATELTDPDFAREAKSLIDKYPVKYPEIYPDPSQPGSSEVLRREGLNIVDKIDNSVQVGINAVKSYDNIYILDTALNLKRQMQSYKNKQDRAGNVIPQPVKHDDHCPDAVRYAVYNRWGFASDDGGTGLNYHYDPVIPGRDLRGLF